MHEDSSRRRASLSRGTHRAEHDGGHGEFEVGGLVDNDGVVSTELEQALAETPGDTFRHVAAHGSGTRERHQRHAPIVDEACSEIRAAIDEQLEDGR
jgi:hypothetical protein